MKKLATLLVFLLVSIDASFAQNKRSAINIRMSDHKPLTIVVDGRHFKRYGNALTIGDLPIGMHDISVYYYYPANNTGFRGYRAHAQLAYKGRISIEPGSMYYCEVDGLNKRMNIRTSRVVSFDGSERSYPMATDEDYADHRDNRRYKYDERDQNQPSTNNEDNLLSYNNDQNSLSFNELDMLKIGVDGKIGDADKLKIMEESLSDKSVTTAQVSEMMDWLNFESTRLDLAKWCYNKTIDNENYLRLSNKFSFQSTKKDLEDFIFQSDNGRSNSRTYNNSNYRGNYNNTSEFNNANLVQQAQMNTLKSSVEGKISDSDKQKLIQQYLVDKTLTTAQVLAIMDWLSFESTRLEIAKYCYTKVIDPENYLQVGNKFSFQSSKSALEDLMYKK